MKRIIISMALVLALALSCATFAESTETNIQVLTEQTEQAAPAEPEQVEPDEEEDPFAPTEEAGPTETNEGLQEAMNALHDAQITAYEEELQAELDSYIANAKLTQEQAGLIMDDFKSKQDAREGNNHDSDMQMPGRKDGKGRELQGGNCR